ncbi:hypothetical protein K2Z84_02100 [Candidatus Binatia bacterium]|nr:hypothetical protein [Candidatus Binatia bacterium]
MSSAAPLARVAVVATLLLCCAPRAGARGGACARWSPEARRTGSVPAVLAELSGIAASRRHPGIYWAHNDSNNAGALFALDETGRVRARFTLRGLRPRDTEDIAVGPCAKGGSRSCIYLADTGDNLRRRREVWIARAVEPETLDGGVLDVDARSFRYPDGSHDAEGLVVDPRSAALYVITKSLDGLGEVYRLDGLGARAGGRAVPIVTLPAPGALARFTTAADAHPDGERLLLRTYTSAWELVRRGARSLEEVFRAPPVEVTAPAQRQGEGIAYTSDGRGYVLAGEGAGSALYRVECASGEPPSGAASTTPAGSAVGASRSVSG